MRNSLTVLSCLTSLYFFAAAPLSAQNCVYYPDNMPSQGGSNVIPFGSTTATWVDQRYQTLIPVSTLGNVPGMINEIAFAPAGSGTRTYDSILIRMTQTSLTTLNGNTNFDTNLGTNPTTVLELRDWAWHTTADTWNRLGLQRGFLYLPPRGSILVDIIVTGAMFQGSGSTGFRSKSIERLYNYRWGSSTPPSTGTYGSSSGLGIELCFDTHDLSIYGESCSGSSGTPQLTFSGSSQIGKIVDINLSGGAAAPGVAVLLLGFDNAAPVFPVPLPGNCNLYVNPLLTTPVPTSSGSATVRIPSPNLLGFRYWVQYADLDPTANPLGVVTTNFGRVLLGN